MPDERQNNGTKDGTEKIMRYFRSVLFELLNPVLALILLVVAIAEALFAPFFGAHLALCAIAAAACSGALFLGIGGLAIDLLGSWAASIHGQLVALHDEEVKKLVDAQRRASPEKPLTVC